MNFPRIDAMAADLAAIRRQHKDSECFAPKPGQRKPVQRRKSSHGPGRPIPPGRTSTGGASDINNSRNHNEPKESCWPSVPAYNQAAAPVAPMLPVSPTRPGASADGARPDEVNNLSQKFNEMASNLTSPEPGEIVETPKGPQRQPERQQRPASPDPDEVIVTPRSQRQPAPSPEAFADNWGPKPQRAAATKASEYIKAYEASKNVPLSQGEAEFYRKAAEREERRSRHDTLFMTPDAEERPQDHHINEDEVVPESQPPVPEPEPVSAASSHTLGRKRPSPEPELSDSAKKQRASNSDFRIRTYEKLGDKGRQQRDELLRKLRLNWGPNWEFVISPELWLTDSKNKTPQHPRNWSATPLEKLIELAELTKKNPQRAASALREAISRRTATGHGSGRLEKSEDIEIAKEIVSRDKTPRGGRTSIASPQMPRAVMLQPQAGPSTLADVLRTSAASATLDHQKTPIQRPARRDSGSGGPSHSPTRPSVAGATQPIKFENDDNIIVSPRSATRTKQWTDDELAKLDYEELFNVQKEMINRVDQLKGEYRRRRHGGLIQPSAIPLSKLGIEVLVKMISDAVLQQSRVERALESPIGVTPGGDESNAMILDD